MGTPITCKVDYGKPAEGELNITGSLEVVWDHKTGEPTDVVGFEIFVEQDGDSVCFRSGEQNPANTLVWKVLEELLGDDLITVAKDHCEHEPPTNGTIQEQIDYQECFDDHYPPMPRG